MSSQTPHKRHSDTIETPEEDEPDTLPVEPDEGLVPDHIPADEEHDRMVDPEE
ncbi:hypothetical protein [Roseateles toxinivorans]|uniref:Uncharacterized protein n=1 Tax=Roseateles toxinivorans TaxID=270368 RepID=A0A4R6QLJ6_9BURK|nr:hypothetical protein [Roseateles toxinivorans]TDP71153.1 hypothetical protein DES47_103131 [Roseateles toxinivorans]